MRKRRGKLQVCLAKKKRRKKSKNIGAGRYNGFGGEKLKGEKERRAVARETKEETGRKNSGVIVSTKRKDLEKVAVALFRNINPDGTSFDCEVHVYLAWKWKGIPRASEEKGQPRWFDIDDLRWDQMMPSDRAWLPRAFNGWKMRVFAMLESNQQVLVDKPGIQFVAWLPEDQEAA
jgi:8-oxo-dGTP pyrophosphatase MutT (NUDIX family)